MDIMIIEIPDNCDNCDGDSFNVSGTIYNSWMKRTVIVSCMRCGSKVFIYREGYSD